MFYNYFLGGIRTFKIVIEETNQEIFEEISQASDTFRTTFAIPGTEEALQKIISERLDREAEEFQEFYLQFKNATLKVKLFGKSITLRPNPNPKDRRTLLEKENLENLSHNGPIQRTFR